MHICKSKEENKSNIRIESCDLLSARLKGHYATITLGEARDGKVVAIEMVSSIGNEVQRRFILGVGQRTNWSLYTCMLGPQNYLLGSDWNSTTLDGQPY